MRKDKIMNLTEIKNNMFNKTLNKMNGILILIMKTIY